MDAPFISHDLEESVSAVSSVYCPHALTLDPGERHLHTQLATWGTGRLAVVDLAYGAKVRVDAGSFPDLYLFMCSRGGSGVVQQHTGKLSWLPGGTLPVSANLTTHFTFGRDFRQSSLPIDSSYLNNTCRRLLGYAPTGKVRFALQPFPSHTEALWQQTLALMRALPANAPEPALQALLEHVTMMLLTQLPHNHSAAFAKPDQQPGARASLQIVHNAHDYMHAHLAVTSLTVGQVAEGIGVSLRSLQHAFQVHKQTTPQAYLRQLRLQSVRDQLMNAAQAGQVSLVQVAMGMGFFHMGRFAHYYKAMFGESPSQTLRGKARSA